MNESGEVIQQQKWTVWLLRAMLLLLVLFAFLVALELMGNAFRLLGKDLAHQIIQATSNPFVGLFIGLLSTAIIQSSSVTTSMVVAIVATGSLSLESAVPVIMGANIGTTITSAIVSIGYIMDEKELRRAFAAATVHSLFNLLSTLILFPLEYYFKLLSGFARLVASRFSGPSTVSFNFFQITVRPVTDLLASWLNHKESLLLGLSAILLIVSIRYFSALLKEILIDDSQRHLEKIVFDQPVKALLFGVALTASVRSSAVTTSLVVPLVALDRISIKKAFPFVMGANIGTTITALLAAISRSDAALSIALVHVLFNVIGVLIFFPFPAIRNIPVRLAKGLSNLAAENRLVGFAYILLTFFLIPFLLIYITGK
ncbi:MAG: Na/Pi symporter [Bacteroidota bacterium]